MAPTSSRSRSLLPLAITSALALLAPSPSHAPDDPNACAMSRVTAQCGGAAKPVAHGAGIAETCANPCVREMVQCVDNPVLGMSVGPSEVNNLKVLAGLCAAQKGQPGDGVCNILDIEKYSEGMKHRGGPLDCQEEMVREMFDCVDNALLADQHDAIVTMQHMCAAAGPAASAGDGSCDPAEIKKYESASHGQQSRECGSSMMRELFDCVDDPAFVAQRAQIEAMQKLCASSELHPPGAGRGDCMHQISLMSPLMGRGGACCPADDPCNERDPPTDKAPPTLCSSSCAVEWNPFWHHCSGPLLALMASSEADVTKQHTMAMQIKDFSAMCKIAGTH